MEEASALLIARYRWLVLLYTTQDGLDTPDQAPDWTNIL
jgi:hypothetical protein